MGEAGAAVLVLFVQVIAGALLFAACWAFFKAVSW